MWGCQGYDLPVKECGNAEAIYDIKSVSVLTSSDDIAIREAGKQCFATKPSCTRVMHSE